MIIEMCSRTLPNNFDGFARSVFPVGQSLGNVHVPARKTLLHRLEPRGNSSFARVNLLSATDQANDHRPVLMPVHV